MRPAARRVLLLAIVAVVLALVAPALHGPGATAQHARSGASELSIVGAPVSVAPASAPAARTPWLDLGGIALVATVALAVAFASYAAPRISHRRRIAAFGLARCRRAPPLALS